MALPLACIIAAAQERLTFEAASVKPVESAGSGGGGVGQSVVRKTAGPSSRRYEAPTGGPGTSDPGRIHYPMVTLHFALTKAYGVNDYQIVGPDWLDRDQFDIDATMVAGTTIEQFRTMLRNLLIDRFKMASHKETREFSGFSLIVGKGGPKLKESADSPAPVGDGAPDPPPKPGADGYFPAPDRPGMFLQVTGMPGTADARENFREFTMPMLATVLQNQLKRPVADETGLTAKYDFVLNFSTQGLWLGNGRIAVSRGDGDPPHQPDIAGSLQAQLGLKLEPKKVSQEVVVIDHMEKTPTEN
jgi:uncharacterized protein (TIGR03435 family)